MSPKKNLDYKDMVGKLMSQENISIVHKPDYKTASFDLESRTLFLPEFANVSEDVYDLLIGHEVSHALNTPKQGWHKSTEKRGANFKTFLNVVEDARIEKMIQRKFPGLKSSFKKGYKELYEMDLFGIREKSRKELDDLLLIDRLNLYFKLGQYQSGVSFKENEYQYIEEMENLKTWKDVVTLAEKLFEYCKEEMKEKEQEQEEGDPKSETGDNDLQGDFEQSSSEQNQDSEQDKLERESSEGSDKSPNQEKDGGNNSGDNQNAGDESSSGDDGGNGFNNSEPMSLTDKNFRENEEKLNYSEERDKNPWNKNSSSSLDLPIIEEEFFYDDWRKIENDVKNWRKKVELNGWGI
tara:strand:+ start:705 stop:1760 length:1056 start_codon:yes stop_codon:yes gene_type:complete